MINYDPEDFGIDTITVEVFPQFVNREKSSCWKYQVANVPYVFLRKETTGCGPNQYFIDMQYEYIKKFYNFSILFAVQYILWELTKSNFLVLPKDCPEATFKQFFLYYPKIMCKFCRIDFFFDFERDLVIQSTQNRYLNSSYSQKLQWKQYKGRKNLSKVVLYDHARSLYDKRQTAYKEIAKITKPMRLEIRLQEWYCPFLNLNNLCSDFYTVFNNFLGVLATAYREYGGSLGLILSNCNAGFNAIMEYISKGHIPRSKELAKAEKSYRYRNHYNE